ncbi:hypothetical protein TgHK011_009884 [Trichoderma gracile]|nr:hypothetical protein TgHK011_009884 [Trichoderma gracile]
MQAQSFGAQVVDSVSPRVTHLVVSLARPRTKKVQQAAKIPSIKIVNQSWLADCLSQWRRLDESPYYMPILDADRERSEETAETSAAETEDAGINMNMGDFDEELKEFLGLDDDDDDDEDDEDDNDNDDGNDEGDGEANEDEDGEDASETTDGEGDDSDDPDKRGTKRKDRESTMESDGEGSNPVGESALAKKQRVSRNRGASSLRAVHTPNGEGSSSGDADPPPENTEGDSLAEFDELERELLLGLEAAGS